MNLESIKRTIFDKLGVRQKGFEVREAGRTIIPGIPVIARLDGKAFHTFTRGLRRPFDERLQRCMQGTMLYVADVFDCDFAYTQSDEITLVWMNTSRLEQFIYGGKFQKLVSLTASAASVKFSQLMLQELPEKAGSLPIFDARVWQVDNFTTVMENLFWRQDDATRNSVTMAAQSVFSHRELHGKGQTKMLQMMESKGVIWGDFNAHFKRGVFAKRFEYDAILQPEVLAAIPEKHRPNGPVRRSKYMILDMGVLRERNIDELSVLVESGHNLGIQLKFPSIEIFLR